MSFQKILVRDTGNSDHNQKQRSCRYASWKIIVVKLRLRSINEFSMHVKWLSTMETTYLSIYNWSDYMQTVRYTYAFRYGTYEKKLQCRYCAVYKF
jgi:hypothetical protein